MFLYIPGSSLVKSAVREFNIRRLKWIIGQVGVLCVTSVTELENSKQNIGEAFQSHCSEFGSRGMKQLELIFYWWFCLRVRF